MKIRPVVFNWVDVTLTDTGEIRKAMVPQLRYDKIARGQYVGGEDYPLIILEARSRASHNGYFAQVGEAFNNLPESLDAIAEKLNLKTIPPGGFIDAEHLRKWALCETNWCKVGDFKFETRTEAMRLAKFYRDGDEYNQISVKGTHVIIKTALSQSAAAMTKEPFERSKNDVLDLLSAMTGIERSTLKKEGGRAA